MTLFVNFLIRQCNWICFIAFDNIALNQCLSKWGLSSPMGTKQDLLSQFMRPKPFNPNPGCYLPFSLSWYLLWWCKVDGKQNCGHCTGPWWSLYFSLSQTHNTRRGKPALLSWWSSINYFTKSLFSYTWHCTVLNDEMGVTCQTLRCTGRERKMLVSKKHQQVERGELNFSQRTQFSSKDWKIWLFILGYLA